MKFISSYLVQLLAVFLMTSGIYTAYADTVRLDITATVIAGTCNYENGGSKNVDLGSMTQVQIKNNTDWKNFTVRLSNCTTNNVITSYSGVFNSKNGNLLSNTLAGGAAGVGVAVQEPNSVTDSTGASGWKPITSNMVDAARVPASDNSVTLYYRAALQSDGGVATPGNLLSSLIINLTYG